MKQCLILLLFISFVLIQTSWGNISNNKTNIYIEYIDYAPVYKTGSTNSKIINYVQIGEIIEISNINDNKSMGYFVLNNRSISGWIYLDNLININDFKPVDVFENKIIDFAIGDSGIIYIINSNGSVSMKNTDFYEGKQHPASSGKLFNSKNLYIIMKKKSICDVFYINLSNELVFPMGGVQGRLHNNIVNNNYKAFNYNKIDKQFISMNTEGLITDLDNGVIWLNIPLFDRMNWFDTIKLIKETNINGYNVRLPTKEECKSLLLASGKPSWLWYKENKNNNYFFNWLEAVGFRDLSTKIQYNNTLNCWTSTEYDYSTNKKQEPKDAYSFDLKQGRLINQEKNTYNYILVVIDNKK